MKAKRPRRAVSTQLNSASSNTMSRRPRARRRLSARPQPARAYGQDSAERMSADDARLWLAALVDSSDDAIIAKTLDGIVTSWNTAAQRIYGYAAEEMIGRSITLIIPPERLDEFNTIMRRLRRGQRIDHFETMRVRKDGARIDVSVTISPIKDADGRLIGASTIARDITDRKRIESALRASEERFRALANTVPSIVWTAAPDGTITFANDQWFRYCGITPEQNARNWPQFVLHPDDVDRCVAQWAHALEHGIEYEIEVRNRRYDGEYRWFLTRALPARDAEGNVTAWFGTATDIHDRKLADEERSQLLERERASHAEAQRAVHLRDQFLSIASHELKTPLTALLGNAQMFQRRAQREGGLAARDMRALNVIADQASRLNRMINALLDISRIQTGQLTIERAPLDLCVLAQRVVAEVQPRLVEHTVECQMAEEELVIIGDELRLEQVLLNLIQNAIRYSPAGGPVHVVIERRDMYADISVVDQGIGIPESALPNLFQRFYRAANVEEQHISGMGIGLYVVKEIVTLHGGDVEVESREGIGSTFTVRLPLDVDHMQHSGESGRIDDQAVSVLG